MKKDYYHVPPGCKVINRRYHRDSAGSVGPIEGSYCRTHKKELCRCGWEWFHHYGTDSRSDEEFNPWNLPSKESIVGNAADI
jgi:hypothetical protein